MEDNTDWEKIGKHLSRENSEKEEEAFSQWLRESEENQSEYDLIEKIWNAAELPDENITPDEEKGWNAFQKKIQVKDIPVVEEEEPRVIPFYSSMFFKIAAS